MSNQQIYDLCFCVFCAIFAIIISAYLSVKTYQESKQPATLKILSFILGIGFGISLATFIICTQFNQTISLWIFIIWLVIFAVSTIIHKISRPKRHTKKSPKPKNHPLT